MKQIGKGKHGIVYLNKKGRAAKKTDGDSMLEYRLQKVAYGAAPNGVVQPLDINQDFIYSEYIPLYKITVRNFNTVVKKLIKTLIKIQKKYPTFRHNDLSWRNVFVTKSGDVFIGDFGLANIEQKGLRNPSIKYLKRTYGIYPNSDYRFDIHFFLNSIFIDGSRGLQSKVSKLLPPEYLGVSSSKINMGRLRPDIHHATLPSYKQLFSKLI